MSLFGIVSATALLLLWIAPCSRAQTQPATYKLQMHVKVPMRDGTRLDATVYRPVTDAGPLPVIMMLMALSNYLLTTVLCQFLFIWSPWKLYGKLEYYQLLYVVAGVWSINLVASPLWLRVFRFGPMEWCWRSLTYWKLQPMRLRS